MTDQPTALRLSPDLSPEHRDLLTGLARRNRAEHGANLLGLVLSGSAGRGMATGRSDVDVFVVLGDTGTLGPRTSRSAAIDESLVAIADLERVPPFGTNGWWYRWSFAWAPVPLDRKYPPWELRRHPLTHWHAEELLALLTATLDGDPSAIRATFARIEHLCAAFDSGRPAPVLVPVIDGWGDELPLLSRSAS